MGQILTKWDKVEKKRNSKGTVRGQKGDRKGTERGQKEDKKGDKKGQM